MRRIAKSLRPIPWAMNAAVCSCWQTTILKDCIIACIAALILFLVYDFLLLPRVDVWGAAPQEAAVPLPGDALVHGRSFWQMTVATSIEALPERIFPYFVQMGQNKAGFNSFDWFEHSFGFGIRNTHNVEDKWQHTKAGRFLHVPQGRHGKHNAEGDHPKKCTNEFSCSR